MGILKLFFLGLFWFVGVVLLALLTAIPTMLLWDWLVVKFFHMPEIKLIEAFGLNFLCGILFKSSHSAESKS